MLTDLTTYHGGQMSLLNTDPAPDETRRLKDQRMAVLDQINSKMGQGTLFHGTEGITQKDKRKPITLAADASLAQSVGGCGHNSSHLPIQHGGLISQK